MGVGGKAKRQRSRWASSKQRVFGQLVLVLADPQIPRATEHGPDIEACHGEGQRRSMWSPPTHTHLYPPPFLPGTLNPY